MTIAFQKFGVIGGGSWGTALATALVRAGRDVLLWSRDRDVADSINAVHRNEVYLPGIDLDPSLKATHTLSDMASCDAWLWVVPVQYSRAMAEDVAKIGASQDIPILLCSKGIELNTYKLPSMILSEVLLGHTIAVLSGPSFASEVAQNIPTALTLACEDREKGMALCHAIRSPTFRPYYSSDVVGSQIGGAIKNVMAIATGIASGCQMGENARAALITRGLAEIMRFGHAFGAQNDTLMGLSGLGDLVLSCSSPQSRNMSLGQALGEGQTLDEIMASRKTVSEGVPTTAAAYEFAKKQGIDMPIVEAVYAVLNDKANVQDVIMQLLCRPIRSELD